MALEENIPWLADVPPEVLKRIVDALYRAHKLISSITDLSTLLRDIMEESKLAACAEASSLMLYDPVHEDLYFEVALGETGDQQALKRDIRLKFNEGIAGIAAARREIINVTDARTDPRIFRDADRASNFETRTLLAIPLIDHDEFVGILELVNKIGSPCFTDTDAHIMEMFSGLAAKAIVNARLIEENLRAERLAAIGQAVAGLSHYTKNMITGMSGSTELIDHALEKDDIALLRRSWPIFKRSTDRMSLFMEDMLSFSKPRSPVREACDVGALLDEISQTFQGMFIRKTIALDIQNDLTSPVSVDAHGLHRCILNLLGNAAQAVPDTDGRIQVLACLGSKGELVIEVGDSGPGVSENDLARIFEPFFSTKGSSGTGLGLAVTLKIIKEHGGAVEVSRSPLGGASFRLTIPQTPC